MEEYCRYQTSSLRYTYEVCNETDIGDYQKSGGIFNNISHKIGTKHVISEGVEENVEVFGSPPLNFHVNIGDGIVGLRRAAVNFQLQDPCFLRQLGKNSGEFDQRFTLIYPTLMM